MLPVRHDDISAIDDITAGLRGLGPRALLFLRELDEISWSVEGAASGFYIRSKPERLAENARKVTLIGEQGGVRDVTEETWLIFSRDI